MANLNQLRERVDTWLANHWPILVARQENFFTNRGKYWQGLRAHTITPKHSNSVDADASPDNLDSHPTDQFENWRTVFPEWDGTPIPCNIWVDVYDSPKGKGWAAYIEITFNGVTYRRSRNVGPESHLTKPWAVVEETP